MTLLNIENTYSAQFKEAEMATSCGRRGRGANTRGQHYRALNFELEVFDEDGCPMGTIPGGFPVTHTATHNSPLIRFFRSIGIFRVPEEFDPSELVGMEVRISINNICDNQLGLRSVVDHFFPAIV